VAATVPDLAIDLDDDSATRAGFLTVKKKGADWRSWKLRWCVLDGEHLLWSKPPKIGKATVKPIGSISMQGARINAGRAQTSAQRFFCVVLASGERFFFAGESRKDTVEWVHLLQHVAGHTIRTASVLDAAENSTFETDETAIATKQRFAKIAKGVSKSGYVYFRKDKKNW
jgi:hypothetical protein